MMAKTADALAQIKVVAPNSTSSNPISFLGISFMM